VTVAPTPRRVRLAFGTVAAGASASASAPVDGLRLGDGALAVPAAPLAPELLVTAAAPSDGTIAVTLRNLGPTGLAVPEQTWTVHVLPS